MFCWWSNICFGTLLDNWLINSKLRLKDSSYIKYHNLINKHIKPSLGECPVTDIDNTVVSKFVAAKLRTEKNANEVERLATTFKSSRLHIHSNLLMENTAA